MSTGQKVDQRQFLRQTGYAWQQVYILYHVFALYFDTLFQCITFAKAANSSQFCLSIFSRLNFTFFKRKVVLTKYRGYHVVTFHHNNL